MYMHIKIYTPTCLRYEKINYLFIISKGPQRGEKKNRERYIEREGILNSMCEGEDQS